MKRTQRVHCCRTSSLLRCVSHLLQLMGFNYLGYTYTKQTWKVLGVQESTEHTSQLTCFPAFSPRQLQIESRQGRRLHPVPVELAKQSQLLFLQRVINQLYAAHSRATGLFNICVARGRRRVNFSTKTIHFYLLYLPGRSSRYILLSFTCWSFAPPGRSSVELQKMRSQPLNCTGIRPNPRLQFTSSEGNQ